MLNAHEHIKTLTINHCVQNQMLFQSVVKNSLLFLSVINSWQVVWGANC